MNLVIFDVGSVSDVETLISALTPNTDYLLVRYHEYNYESLKAKIGAKTYQNVAIVQKNDERADYTFVESSVMPRVKDVEQIDPNLNTWNEHISFFAWLRDNCGTQNIDLLACNLWASDDWKYIINAMKSKLNIHIRASLDITGQGGNWILESDNVETIGLYFTEDVKQYRYHFYQTEFYYFDQNNILILEGSGGTMFKSKYEGHINRTYNTTQSVSGVFNGYVTLPSDISNVTQVIACQRNLANSGTSNAHAALRSDGTVMTWGERYTFMYNRSSAVDNSLNNVKRLYTSWACVLALKNDNSLVGWGNGSYNIASPHSVHTINTESVNVKAMPASVTNVKEVYVNEQAYCALKFDGTVEAWGFRYGGGDCSACQTLLVGVKKIAVSVGWGGYFIALRNDGNVVAWKGDAGAGWPSGFSTTIGGTWSGKVVDIIGAQGVFYGILNDGTIRSCGPSFFADARGYNMFFATLPLYTLPAGVTVRFAEQYLSGGATKYHLSNGMVVVNRGSQLFVLDTDQVISNKLFSDGWYFPFYRLNRNGSVTVDHKDAFSGSVYNDPTWGLPAGCDVSSNVVEIYTSEAGVAARKADGTFITWGGGAWGRPLRFDSSANGIRDVIYVIDNRFGYKILRSNNQLLTISNPTNNINNQDFRTTAFSDLSNVTIPTNKNLWIFDNLVYEGSKELSAVELDPFESITPSVPFMRLQNTTIIYKSNSSFRLAKRGMKYGLYSGTTLLSTFAPLYDTMTYTFTNAKVPQLGAVTLSIGLLSVNFQNTLFTFQVNTIENPFLSPPDAPSIIGVSVNLATSSASVNFSLPTWDGGAPITSIKYSLDGGLSFTTASSLSSPLNLTALTLGAYDFVLVATNMIGDSYGTTSNIVMCNPPSAPTITSVTGGNRSISVAFTAPAEGSTTSSSLDVTGMNSNTYTVSGNANALLNGQYIASVSNSYNAGYFAYFLFDGCNNTLWISKENYSNPSGMGSYHSYVGSVSTAVETIGTVSGEWLQIKYPNPIIMTGYNFSSTALNYYPNTFWLVGSNNGTTWYPLNYQSGQWAGAGNINTYTVNESLTAGAFRFFRLIISATNGGSYVRLRNFTINGYPALSNSIVGYKYSVNGGAYVSKGTRVSPLTITQLLNSSTYNVTMKAINAAGDSVASNVSSNVTLSAFAPEAPVLNSATIDNQTITFTYTASYNGGSAITGIQYSVNGGSYVSLSPIASPYTITGLTNGTTYAVKIRAVNSIGASVASNEIGSLIPKSVPMKPWITSIVPSSGSLRAYWNHHELYNFAQYYGGSPLTAMKYSVNGGVYANVYNFDNNGYLELTGLENGTEYAIRFIAVNALGDSLPSDPSIGIPCDIPSAPTITSITAIDGTANISFTLGSNGGRPVTEYQYMLNNPFKYEIDSALITGSRWIIVPQHDDFNLGTDDFTIEWYQYIPWQQTFHSRVFSFGSESTGISFCFKWEDDQNTSHSTFKLKLCINDTWYDFGYANPYPWQHIALSRVSGVLRIFINGVQFSNSLDCSANIVHSKRLVIGNDDSLQNSTQFFGCIQAFTYITGWGKYVDTFTPPTYPVLSVPQGKLVLFVIGRDNDAVGTLGSTAIIPSFESWGKMIAPGYFSPAYITIPDDTVSPIAITGLTNGTDYSVAIRAKNEAGWSDVSNKFSFRPLSVPDAPEFISATYGNISAVLDFSANVLSGNSPIIGYKLSTNSGPFISIGMISSPYTVSGLTNGTSYSFRLKAVSAIGDSSSSLFSPEVIPRRVPDAPVISVVDNILQSTVSFAAGASNGGSEILSYVYSYNDGEEVSLLAPQEQTYVLELGQTYTFSARVTNDVGSSATTTINLVGKSFPDAPVITSIEAGNKSARVYYTAGSSNYSNITGYKYKLNSGAYQTATVSADSSILITGLSENITYNITIVAVNAIGTSEDSNSMSVTPYTIPGAPTLNSVSADNASVTFAFTAGASNSSDISAFKYSLNNAAYVTLSDLSTEVVLSDLSNGVLYNIKVKATNAAGDSLASNSMNFMPYTIPNAPVITSVTAGNESADVYFIPGFFNGSNITQYKYALNGGDYDGTQFASASELGSPIHIDGLSNGVVYTVSILAINGAGESNASNSSTSFAPFITQSSPNPPIIQNIEVSDGTATISYEDDFNPGSAIIGYKYSLNGSNYLWFTQTSSPLIITGLTNGQEYTMRVKAVNNSGASAPTEQYSFTPGDVPAAPLILNAIAGNQTATLYLGEPDSKGHEITGYYCSLNGESYYAVEMSGNQIVLGSLTNGVEYTAQIKYENSVGMSLASNVSETFITNGLPYPPTITDLTVGDETVSISFSEANGNGKPIIKYSYCLVVDGIDGEYLSTSDTTSPIVINGLTNGVSYSIKMKSMTANGESDAGLESESFVPCGIPVAPVITHVSYENDQLTIHFIEENTNGKPVTDHLYSIDNGMYFTTSQLTSPLIISNLTSGGNSTVRIKTVTEAGTSVASNQSNSFIPYSMPAEPTITLVSSQDKALAVHFVDGSFNGTTLIGYKYKLNDDNTFYWCNTTVSPILISGLTNGTPYTVSLKTISNLGESDVAVYGSAVIPSNLQLPPNIVNVDSSNSTVIVSYTNPELNGATITGYKYSLNDGEFVDLDSSAIDASNSKLTISGLNNGISYTITIKSVSANGASASSNISKPVSPFSPPSPPSISRVVTGSQIAYVHFTDGALNGSPAILGYKYSLDGVNYTWSSVTSSPIPLTGLTNNLAYTVRILAVTSVNQSAPSIASALFVPFTLPEPPTINSVSVSNGTATISYTNGATNGRPFTGFRYSLNGGAQVTIGLENPFTVTGLTNGLTYLATMSSINAAGTSVASSPSPAFVPYTVPGAPVIASIVPSDSALTINISNPNLNGIIENNIPIIGYSYSFNNSTFTYVPTANNATSFTITGLVNGTTYQVYVKSVCNIGLSPASSPVSGAPRTTPSPVTITSVTPGNKSVSVAFVAGNSNGAAISGYKYSLDGTNYVTATQTSSPISIFNLTNGVTYSVYLKATNTAGDSSASLVSTSFMPYATLTAPLIKSIVPAYNGATVNVNNSYFGTVDGSGISIVGYRYSFDDLSYSQVDTSNANSFDISGLSNGSSYRVYVKTVTNIGESPKSLLSNLFYARSVPDAPTITGVEASDSRVFLSFTDGSNNGSSISGYKYSLDDITYYTALQNTSPLTLYSLNNATSYNIRLKSVNEMGDSPASIPSDGIVPFGVPFAPVITEIIPGNLCAYVYFNPVDDNGSPIIKYKYSLGSTIMDISGLTSPLTVPNLVNKTLYNIVIVAANAAGDSYPSNSMRVTAGAPTAPVITEVVAGPKNIKVFFDIPLENGSPITQYNVTFDGVKYVKAPGLVSPITLGGLTNGLSYNITFQAVNKNGVSKNSNTIANVIPYDIPAKITITSVLPRYSSALVTFAPPANNGSAITKYAYAMNADTTYTDISGLVPPLLIPGMPNNTSYTLKLVAYNAAGISPVSAPSKAAMYVYTPPAQIKLKSIVAAKNSLIVDFLPPAANGAVITTYKYALNADTVYTDIQSTTVPFTITGLDNNVNYNIKLIATNEAGDSVPSAPAPKPVMFVFLPPAAPVVTSIVGGNQCGFIYFTAPKTNGAPISGYKCSVDGGATKIDLSGVISPLMVSGLTNDTLYNVLLYADSEAGLSPASAVKSFKPIYSAPEKPVIGTIINLNGGASVSFTPGLENGSPITEYLYSLDAGVTKISTGTLSTTFNISGLTNDVAYNLLMYAVNAVGTSLASAPKPFMPVYKVPIAPTIGTITTTATSASVAFTPGLANGAPITSYKYSLNAGSTWVDVSQLAGPIVISGLVTKTSYSVILRAVNEVGESLSSLAKPFITK